MTGPPKAGEYLVGAYLKYVEKCEFILYNLQSSMGNKQREIDVIGVKAGGGTQEVFVCEVGTHLRGMGYGGPEENFDRLQRKLRHDRECASEVFDSADNYKFQVWSLKVRPGTEELLPDLFVEFEDRDDMDLELIINEEYSHRIGQLQDVAGSTKEKTDELGFRFLQILEHLE